MSVKTNLLETTMSSNTMILKAHWQGMDLYGMLANQNYTTTEIKASIKDYLATVDAITAKASELETLLNQLP